jgi:hypothetical protein
MGDSTERSMSGGMSQRQQPMISGPLPLLDAVLAISIFVAL